MPKIFVQGETGAACGTRRDAAHALESRDAHGDEIACAMVCEGIGEPKDASRLSCDAIHELVGWAEDDLPCLVKEMDYELDLERMVAELSKPLVVLQLDFGNKNGELPLHLAIVVAYKGRYVAIQLGDAKVCHIGGALGARELCDDPGATHVIIQQMCANAKTSDGSRPTMTYTVHSGAYEEGDLILVMTPGLWERVGVKGLAQAFCAYATMDEGALMKCTRDLIVTAGHVGGSEGLTMAGLGLTKFTQFEKLGIKAS